MNWSYLSPLKANWGERKNGHTQKEWCLFFYGKLLKNISYLQSQRSWQQQLRTKETPLIGDMLALFDIGRGIPWVTCLYTGGIPEINDFCWFLRSGQYLPQKCYKNNWHKHSLLPFLHRLYRKDFCPLFSRTFYKQRQSCIEASCHFYPMGKGVSPGLINMEELFLNDGPLGMGANNRGFSGEISGI